MLTALMSNGEKICLADHWEKSKLQSLRENNYFFCPLCQDKVILKLGDKKIYHFSHLRNKLCELEHENESEYHMSGKKQLYHWLYKQALNPVLEYYDSAIKQRADIMFYYGDRSYVLEFQCSPISDTIFINRTNGYKSIGYYPLWILGANQLTRKNKNLTSFSDFHFLFLQKLSSTNWTIPFYCSQTKNFIFHQSIQTISIRNALSKQRVENIDKININQFLIPKEGGEIKSEDWIKELNKWKNRFIRLPGAYQNPFLRELYQHNLNLLLLPAYLGLPIPNSLSIITPPLIWQTYLFIDVFLKANLNTPISLNDIFKAFRKRVLRNHIQIRRIPLINEENTMQVIKNYLQILVKTNLLAKTITNNYILVQSMKPPRSIMEQQHTEELFYKKFAHFIF